MYRLFIKRLLDIVLSAAALLVLSPVFLLVALLVRARLGSPVLFRQARPGRDEKIFIMHKFRTMTDEKDETGALKPDGARLTRLGRFLRASSLDELPELYHILKGDMSFVGPRPLVPAYLPYYTQREHLRHSVRPGLTGLAQVNGRNNLTWDEKFAYDLQYVEHITFLGDVSIVLRTVGKVLRPAGIGERGAGLVDFDVYRRKQIQESGKGQASI